MNLRNFAVVDGDGVPSGEDGMETFGIGGRVREWMSC